MNNITFSTKCTSFSSCALNRAARDGNIYEIKRIVDIEGPLSFLQGDYLQYTPLHATALCKDQKSGYFAAKKLLQLGCPVNIAGDAHHVFTPLDIALDKGKLKIAVLLLRNGGIPLKHHSCKSKETLGCAKKRIMKKTELIFAMHCMHILMPQDIVNTVLQLSIKLELHDFSFHQKCMKDASENLSQFLSSKGINAKNAITEWQNSL